MPASHAVVNLVGDVQPNRAEPETLFRHVRGLLGEGDLNLCQLECTLSDKGTLLRDVRNPAHRVPPENLRALTAAPFHGVSFASNNALDYGTEAFVDTLDRLDEAGIFVVGAGRSLEDSRQAVIRDVNGVRIAFVDSCSILPYGYEATRARPGIAPLPAQTYYEPLEKLNEQPGTPSRTVTVAARDELNEVLATITAARDQADLVFACFHWGVHFTHDLAQYQADVGYAAIDAGADVVVGTHPHCLQAVDTYRGKPIFYSLGNFAFEQPGEVALAGAGSYLRHYGIAADTSVPGHPHPSHCRPSAIVRLEVTASGVQDIRIIPTYLNGSCEPEQVVPGSPEYDMTTGLLVDLSAEIGSTLVDEGGYLRIANDAEKDDTRLILARRNVSYPSLRTLSTQLV